MRTLFSTADFKPKDSFRLWRETIFERIVPGLHSLQVQALVDAAQVCDGIVKGLRHRDWPLDPWAALQRLALMLLETAQGHPGRMAGGRHASLVLKA